MRDEAVNIDTSNAIRPSPARAALAPLPFVVAVVAIYLFGLAAQMLTAPAALTRVGAWPFLLVQPVLIGVWYELHARRLHDAARSAASAQGVAVICALAIVLLMLVGAFYMDLLAGDPRVPQSLVLVRELVTFSRGASDLVTWLGLVACAALLIPPVFSIWAAVPPRRTA